MKPAIWFVTAAALLVAYSGLAVAQCAGHQNPGGYDLLSTFSGTQDDLSGMGLGVVTFTGVALPGGLAGNADTAICRIDHLPSPIPPSGATLNIQIVALYLTGSSTYHGQNVTVYATINQTNGRIPTSQLPQPDMLPIVSTGNMTVFSNGTFDTNVLNIQADIIVVPQGQPVTATPIFTSPMPADQMSASGSTWSSTAPAGYPNSTTFPPGGFFVSDPSGNLGAVVPIITSRIVRASLYGLGLLLAGIAVLKIRSGINGGRLTLRPVYLMGMAVMAWFVAWRTGKLMFPTIAHAAAVPVTTCVPHTVSAFFHEGGTVVVHKVVTAVCTTTNPNPSTSTSTSASLGF